MAPEELAAFPAGSADRDTFVILTQYVVYVKQFVHYLGDF